MAWQILDGDCIDVMRTLPAESVDALITSPPYAMQRKATYGGVPESDYPAWTVAWMAEARRLLKPDGSVVINIRPHVKDGQISDYTLRTRLALREAGWAEVEEMIWHKPDAMPTAPADKPRRAWESLHWFAKHGRPWSDPKAGGQQPTKPMTMSTGRAHSHNWGHRDDACNSTPLIARVSNVVRVPVRCNENDNELNRHPAVYPPKLAQWVAQLVCPPGGTILDPFNGSASTGVAAIRNGWDYIGIEAVPEYADMSRRRLAALDETAA